jgi:predicted lactoylglutathione lyase
VKKLIRLLIVAIVAGAVATMIVQRDRLRQMDREQLAAQIRDGIQSLRDRSKEATQATAEMVDDAAEAAAERIDDAADVAVEKMDAAAEALEEASENTDG